MSEYRTTVQATTPGQTGNLNSLMKTIAVPVVYENWNAVVALVTVGGGLTRTKHLRARMFLGKEMVEEGRLRVVCKKGEEMETDGFSKPYDPVKHKPFAIKLLGVQKSVNGWALKKKKGEEKEKVFSLVKSS